MGREQGDELDKNAEIYVGEVNGEAQERPAYTPADHVNLQARGWVRKSENRGAKPPVVASVAPQQGDAARPGSSSA